MKGENWGARLVRRSLRRRRDSSSLARNSSYERGLFYEYPECCILEFLRGRTTHSIEHIIAREMMPYGPCQSCTEAALAPYGWPHVDTNTLIASIAAANGFRMPTRLRFNVHFFFCHLRRPPSFRCISRNTLRSCCRRLFDEYTTEYFALTNDDDDAELDW